MRLVVRRRLTLIFLALLAATQPTAHKHNAQKPDHNTGNACDDCVMADACHTGFGVTEEMLLFRELGRRLGPLAMLGSVLGAHAAAAAAKTELAAAIASGETVVAPGVRTTDGVQIFGAAAASHVLLLDARQAALFAIADLGSRSERSCLDSSSSLLTASLGGARPVLV